VSEIPPPKPAPPQPERLRPRHHPHAVRTSAIGFGVLFFSIVLNWAAIHFGLIKIPPNTNPWDTPRLDTRPGLFVHFQMQKLLHDETMCRAALDSASGLSYTPQNDMHPDAGCGFDGVVRADKTPIAFNDPPVATCALTAALYWWQRDLEKLARQELHTTIARIDQEGTYACRNVNSEKSGPRSEHATANAIDIEGFETADGRHITVKDDWLKPTPEGRFLRSAHDSACSVFGEVLGPDYNAIHASHFHLDEAAWMVCR